MRIITLLIGLFLNILGNAQNEIKDSSILITSIRFSYAAQIPGGNLVNRFGMNNNLGLHTDVKFKNGLLAGIEGNFLFGRNVKEDPLIFLRTSSGDIISQDGTYAKVLMYERGFAINLYGGYLLKKLNPNPNSGILFKVGVGFLQHKIRIENNQNKVVSLQGDYKKGYDRLTNGLGTNLFLGYQFLSNSRLVNFFGGFEFYNAFTMNRRSWNIDQMRKDDTKRIDQLLGIRVGWILLLYRRAPKQFYYN